MGADALREKVKSLMPQAKEDLARMVSFKSVHDAKQFPAEECERMVDFTIEAFSGAGVKGVEAYETPDGSKGRSSSVGSPTCTVRVVSDP